MKAFKVSKLSLNVRGRMWGYFFDFSDLPDFSRPYRPKMHFLVEAYSYYRLKLWKPTKTDSTPLI